jgi:ABC-2 type transport system permease protein
MLPFFIASLLVGLALIPLYSFFAGLYEGGGTSAVQVGFIDEDHTATSAALRTYCAQDLGYAVNDSSDLQNLNDLLANHTLSVIITVPAGFEHSLLTVGASPQQLNISYMQDYQNLFFVQDNLEHYTDALQVMAAGTNHNASRYLQMLAQHPAQSPALHIQAADKTLGQKQAQLSTYQQILGFYASFSFMLLIGLALAVLDDRRRGTFARMRLTSIPVPLYIVGLCAAALVMNAVMLLPLVIFFMASGLGALFNVGALLAVCLPYALFCIGFALITGLVVKSPSGMAAVTVGVGVILSMLGGLYWPISYVPSGLQLLGHFTPQFWFGDALTQFTSATAAAGNGGAGWLLNVAIIALFALLMFIIASVRIAARRRSM